MVSTLSILFMVVTLLITLVIPVALVLVLCIRKRIHIVPVLVGAGVFFLFQMILRIPALQIATSISPAFQQFVASPILGGLFLGLTAGIFEEFGRYIGYRALLKRRNTWKDGFAFGLGHGGIEAVLLVGLGYVNNLLYAIVINSGQWDAIAAVLPQETAQQVYEGLVNTPAHMFLIGGVERIFAMTVQVALSILVLYGIRKRRFVYVLLAVALHCVLDSPLALLTQKFGMLGTELYVMLCAVVALVYILYSRKSFAKLDEMQQPELDQPILEQPGQQQ